MQRSPHELGLAMLTNAHRTSEHCECAPRYGDIPAVRVRTAGADSIQQQYQLCTIEAGPHYQPEVT